MEKACVSCVVLRKWTLSCEVLQIVHVGQRFDPDRLPGKPVASE
jgi:hypothetical protein